MKGPRLIARPAFSPPRQTPASPLVRPVAGAVDRNAMEQLDVAPTADVALAVAWLGIAGAPASVLSDVLSAPPPWKGLPRLAAMTTL